MTPEQTPQEPKPSTESVTIESVTIDKIIDTSLKSVLTDLHGEPCVKKITSSIFCIIGLVMGLILFYKGLSSPEGDFVASYEVFQFFIVSGLAGLGLSTVENLFKKK